MREIKFRAFDNIDKKMYKYAIQWFNGELHVHKNAEHNWEWINIGCGREDGEVDYSNELLQYTWLKDINGNEIYEGDIVKCDSWNPSTYKVWFDRWGFCFYNEWDTFYNDCKYLDKFEVIWNIYEPTIYNL